MKKVLHKAIFSFIIILIFNSNIFSLTVTSNSSGNWNNKSTWTVTDMTGQISVNTINKIVTGNGTSFTSELIIGDEIFVGIISIGMISSITDDNTLVLTAIAPSYFTDVNFLAQIIPHSNDNVILDGDINADVNVICSSLTINSGRSLDMQNYSLTASSIVNSGILDMHSSILTVNSPIANDNGLIRFSGNNGIHLASGTIEYYGTDQIIATGAYENLILSGGGTKTAGNTISASMLDNGGDINFATTLNMGSYVLDVNSVSIENTNSTIIFSGPTNGVAVSTGTIEYNGADQIVEGGFYADLIISGTGTKTATDNLIFTNLSNLSGANLNMSDYALIGDIDNSGSKIIFSGFLNGRAIPLGTVEYNGDDGQEIAFGSYENLIINSVGNHIPSGNLNISTSLSVMNDAILDLGLNKLEGSFTPGISGTILLGSSSTDLIPSGKTWGGTINYNANANQTIVDGTYNNLTLSTGWTKTFTSSPTSILGF